MADRFWKSMPAAFKKPGLDELFRRLRALDYTQVDERLALMLNAILQLESQGECRESATEAVLIVGSVGSAKRSRPGGCPGTSMEAVTLMMGTNDVSRGESWNMMRLPGKVSCILEELRIDLDPNVLTICTVLYNMMADQNAMNMNEMADQAQKLQESAANCDQIKSEI